MATRFNIGVPPRSCFYPLGETVNYGLRELGYESELTNYLSRERTNIIFGSHLADPLGVPSGSILYNFEQVGGYHFKPEYFKLAERCEVWDYSAVNVERWKQLGIDAKLVELGYQSEMSRVPKAKEEYDVLFYGMMTLRRDRIMVELAKRGLTLRVLYGYTGEALDKMIAKARVVLNIHNYATCVFEIARVSYILSNKKCVVTEESVPDVYDYLIPSMVVESYEKLAEACAKLAKDDELRLYMKTIGYSHFAERREADILRRALA